MQNIFSKHNRIKLEVQFTSSKLYQKYTKFIKYKNAIIFMHINLQCKILLEKQKDLRSKALVSTLRNYKKMKRSNPKEE